MIDSPGLAIKWETIALTAQIQKGSVSNREFTGSVQGRFRRFFRVPLDGRCLQALGPNLDRHVAQLNQWWAGEGSTGAAGACGKVSAVHEILCGDRLLESQCPLRADPTDSIGRRMTCTATVSP